MLSKNVEYLLSPKQTAVNEAVQPSKLGFGPCVFEVLKLIQCSNWRESQVWSLQAPSERLPATLHQFVLDELRYAINCVPRLHAPQSVVVQAPQIA